METVKIRVHAGGGWEGHVVYTAINPSDKTDRISSSNLEEVIQFCEKRNLKMDEKFKALVHKHLVLEHKTGLVIPHDQIEQNTPISSATNYLKKYFSEYIMTVDDL